MLVGTLKVRVHLHVPVSLKQKRSDVKRILARVKKRVPVAFAEVGELDKWQVTELGFACVSNDQAICDRMLDGVEDEIECKADAEILSAEREIIRI